MITIRQATANDSPIIHQFVIELAQYEKADDQVTATIDMIRSSIFGSNGAIDARICEYDGEPIGFAVFFYNYSTWQGKKGLYLEDLYIAPAHRGKGAGKAMLQHLAKLAIEQDCGRFEWSVLDWNSPAIDFYESIGAQPKDEWIMYQLAGQRLTAFANKI